MVDSSKTIESFVQDMMLIPGHELEDYIFRMQSQEVNRKYFEGFKGFLRMIKGESSNKMWVRRVMQELALLNFPLYSYEFRKIKIRLILLAPLDELTRQAVYRYVAQTPHLAVLYAEPKLDKNPRREVMN